MGTTLDLTALAAMASRSAELAARIEAGDVSACFDADEFLKSIERVTADATAFVDRGREPLLTTHDDDYARKVAFEAADGLLYVIGYLTGSFELQAILDDARADSEPDD